jgi:NAD(P)-dependent dehydrogenase (short-subunit alcohol dehydrogenase family)
LPDHEQTRFASYPSLRGKGVLVTGGATGIGGATARAFAGQGAQVAVVDRDREAGEELARELGGPHLFLHCDVMDVPALRAAVDDTARAFGRLDVVIANAADDTRHDVEAVTPEQWDASLAVNLSHQFFAAQAAEPHLRATGGGTILCLGSIAWLNNTTGMVAYTTAKAGVHGLVRTLARLWGEERIRVNALVPGWTMTDRQRALWVDEEAERAISESQCLPGRVMPDDIARAALFLASDDAGMITQQALIVDGGWV